MSKVVFAAYYHRVANQDVCDAVLYDIEDKRVVVELELHGHGTSDLDFQDDPPFSLGLWVWEGSVEWEDDGDERDGWFGTWRRPTEYELGRIAVGVWPRYCDTLCGYMISCDYADNGYRVWMPAFGESGPSAVGGTLPDALRDLRVMYDYAVEQTRDGGVVLPEPDFLKYHRENK